MKNIRPIILDTTYILPLFGVSIIELNNYKKIAQQLWNEGIEGFNFILPTTCLMEALFKLTSEYRKSNDISILNRYSTALPSIKASEHVLIYDPLLNFDASQIAIKIRHEGHSDLMDCLIAATAVALKGIFLTQEEELRDLLPQIPETSKLIIWSWKEFVKNFEERT